jgi:hypothetical protein
VGGELRASISASDIASAGNVNITIFNPPPVGGTSAAKTLTINNPVPAITSLQPAGIKSGDDSFTLTVNGSNFVSTSRVRWNGSERPTTFVSSTKLTAAISAQDIERGSPPKDRTAQVTVSSPPGALSNVLTFSVTKQ